MKKLGFLLVLFSVLLACQKDYNTAKLPINYIPNTTSEIIVINNINDFLSSSKNNDLFSSLYNKELEISSEILKYFNTEHRLYLAFSRKNERLSDYLVLTENDSTLFVIDSLPNVVSETLSNSNIVKSQIDSTLFYHKVMGNVFAGSNNLELLKTLESHIKNNNFEALVATTNPKAIASLLFNPNARTSSKLLFNTITNSSNVNNSILDLSLQNNGLTYNGISTIGDTLNGKLAAFKSTAPQKINTVSIAPADTKSLLSLTYDNYATFNANLAKLNKISKDSTQNFLNFTNEIAQFNNKSGSTIACFALDMNLALESINRLNIAETFREIEIYEFNNPAFFKTRLHPFITFESAKYFTVFSDFILFSDSTENLKAVLRDALNDKTIANSDAFINISDKLSDEASLFIFKDEEDLAEILELDTKSYNANVVQFIYEDNYAHVNGVIQKYKKRGASNAVSEAFTTTLEADILGDPQTVENYINNGHDIMVQDVNNMLYRISNSGNVLWQKQLQSNILGKIEQIDTYKNGRLQLVFSTKNRVYVLDRNGNDVGRFPLKFRDDITQPIAVFDYDNNRNYRLLVTQGKNLLMYDARGKSVNGFNYKNNGSVITTQPKHFRIGSKDYIVFAAGDKMKILNRVGKTRIGINENINFSDNEIFLYKNKFTTTNTLGQLLQFDTRGKLTTKNLNLPENHAIETTSKTLVTLTENKLNIRSRTVNLDFGEYTKPKIFYLNDKIYVSVTDLQAKKVYLFDSQAKAIPNFPVFGTASAELQKLDSESGLELVTQSDDTTIIVYKLY